MGQAQHNGAVGTRCWLEVSGTPRESQGLCAHCIHSLSQGFSPSDHSPGPLPVPSLSFQPQTCRGNQRKEGVGCKVKHGSVRTFRGGECRESKRASSSRTVGMSGLPTGYCSHKARKAEMQTWPFMNGLPSGLHRERPMTQAPNWEGLVSEQSPAMGTRSRTEWGLGVETKRHSCGGMESFLDDLRQVKLHMQPGVWTR